MIALTNTTAQTLQPGQAITFDQVLTHTGCGECYRQNTSSIKMRGCGVYDVHFSGNIGGPTAATPVQLSIQVGGATLQGSLMISTPAAADDLNNVAKTLPVRNCCDDYDRLTVVNTGTVPVTVGAGSIFYVHRLG